MSLAATLNSGGMRPASFLPTIKCSSCGDEIEISAMGEHLCGKAAQPSASAHSSMSSNTHSSMSSDFSSMFSIRQANANAPSHPSPLQYGSGQPPQTRIRAPTVGSSQMSPPKPPRTAPPRVNTDVANKPFLAPTGQMDTPISPALSSRSGSSFGSKPLPPLRSMTSPMPRLWDPRPPSPELSANLDCAFPPFPTSATPTSRPGTANGRRTPSERGGSRNGSRPEIHNTEPRSPMSNAGENVMNRMNTLKNGPFDPNRRRPSNDERAQREFRDMKRRPSLPAQSFTRDTPSPPPQMPELPKTESSAPNAPLNDIPSAANGPAPTRAESPAKQPPERPTRPEEEFSPAFLDGLNNQPDSNHQALRPPAPLRSLTTPAPSDSHTDLAALPALTKIASEPVPRADTASTDSLAPEASSMPPRGQSRNPGRVDARMQDAPPVPKPVQLHRSDSKHKPSGSGSSTASSVPSLGNTNSDSGASPIGSAASSVDVLSPLSYQVKRHGEEKDLRPAGLNVKSQQNPGMRAEQPKDRAPPRNFTRPSPPKEIALPAVQPPVSPESISWPLESPMDPAMRNQRFGTNLESPTLGAFPVPRPRTPNSAPAISMPSADDYDPYRAPSPQPPPSGQQRRPPPRSKTDAYPQPVQSQRPASPFRSKTDTDLPSSIPQQPMDQQQLPSGTLSTKRMRTIALS